MTFGDLTQRPFEGMINDSLSDQAKKLSAKAVETKKDTWMECQTRGGNLHLMFKPTGRVEITWRDRGGIKEGWFMKDWTIETTLRKWDELMDS